MAEVKRTLIGSLGKKKPGLLVAKPKIQVELPITPSEPEQDINKYHLLVHGEKKIGKTTLFTVEKGVFLLTFDPFQKALRIMQAHCPDWETFMAYLDKLEAAARAGRYPYKRVVVDGCDLWYLRCQDWSCRKLVIEHPADEGYGKGWDLIKMTFARALDRLLALPGGCWFITHSHWREIETRGDKRKVTKLLPLMKGAAEEILVGRVDGWFAYDYMEDERVLIVRGDERTGAGNRMRDHFLTTDNRPVIEVPMGESEFDGWENFNKAFNNQQEFATIAERDRGLPKAGAVLPQKRLVAPAKKPVLAVKRPILIPKA